MYEKICRREREREREREKDVLSLIDPKKHELISENIYDFYYSHHGKKSGCLVKHSVKNTEKLMRKVIREKHAAILFPP